METMKTTKIEATKANIDKAINDIQKYAASKGYQFLGELKKDGILSSLFGGDKPKFESKSQEKVCNNYLSRLDRGVRMSTANRFLHFLYKHVYKLETAPRVDYSQRELEIRASRKAYVAAKVEAEKLRLKYKEIKGDFYKK